MAKSDPAKAYVLMSKNTGELAIGFRILFFDKEPLMSNDIPGAKRDVWKLFYTYADEYDGWVIQFDTKLAFFFNRASEEFFEVLGEL